MKICSLASGSAGNSLFIETIHTKILVDAGISKRQLAKRLSSIGVSLDDIDAVIVTHEHSDHAASLPTLEMPVYVAHTTTHVWKDKVSNICEFEVGEIFSIRDLEITPFSVPHDAIDPVGFTVTDGKKKLGIVTDIGSITGLVVQRLMSCDALVVESNHDNNLLMYSNYPWELKQRIRSRLGHLSNSQCSSLINTVIHEDLRCIVLAHLSEVNNSHEAALRETLKVISRRGLMDKVKVVIAPRKRNSEVIEF